MMPETGMQAHTDYGLGTIKEIDNGVRGGRQFRVAGKGFSVWVPETRLRVAREAGLEATIDPGGDTVNEDNSTTLPYDPSPQFPVDMFRRDQTILPGDHEIDTDDRLHPADSLTKKRKGPNRPYPGPSPDLFAKGASVHYAEEEPFGGEPYKEWGEDEWHSDLPDGPERTFDAGAHHFPGDEDFPHDYEQPRYSGGAHEAWEPSSGPSHSGYHPGKPISVPSATERGSYRPAGLDKRYAYIPEEVDERDPITAFRRDPVQFMERRAYAIGAGDEERLFQKFADYTNLLESDKHMRTAAWADVRQKAQRLRHEGKVTVNHVTPQHIYATVHGDHGTYDTMIVKGASGAFSAGQSISNWSCDCDWGKWAFQRKYSYVGRLCSHAYAAYLDMQSHFQKDNGGKFKAASIVDDFKDWANENNDGHMDRGSMHDFINTCDHHVTREEATQLYDYLDKNVQQAPERDYDIPYTFDNEKAYKTAEALRTRPLSLTPDLREVPEGEDEDWVDVTKDERETTGPDQIVHFSAIAAKLHTADAQSDYDAAHPDEAAERQPGAHTWLDNFKGIAQGQGFMDPDHPSPGQPGYNAPAPATPANTTGVTTPAPAPTPAGGTPPLGKPSTSAPGSASTTPSSPFAGQSGNADAPVPGAKPANPGTPADIHTQGGGLGGGWGTPPGGGAGSYTVKPGDTLSDIAKAHGLNGYQDLAKSNNISNPDLIHPGQQIKLPGDMKAADPASGPGSNVPGVSSVAPAVNSVTSGGWGGGTTTPKPTSGGWGGGTTTPKPPSPPQVTQPSIPQAPKLPVPGAGGGLKPTSSLTDRLHRVAADDDNDDDDRRPDTGEAASMLDRLRDLSAEDPSDHYHHMDEYNDEVRDLVEDLNEAGVDAMPFVAALHQGAPQSQRKDSDPSNGDPSFAGMSNPNWADEAFNGSGPDPQQWISDSQSYLDAHEPDLTDVTDLPDGDIIKFNDSRSKPQQGPRQGRRRQADNGATIGDFSQMNGMDPGTYTDPLANGSQMAGEGTVASRHYADDVSGYFNPNNPTDDDWEEGSGKPFMDELGHQMDQHSPQMPGGGGGQDGAEGDEAAGMSEEAPELLALARRNAPSGGFSLEAFDRGEFSFDDAGGGGELRRAARIGGGPRQAVRVDPGARGHKKRAETYNPPEDFGNNGDPELTAYGEPSADPSGADIVASFQRSAGALGMMYGQNEARPGSVDDFASSPMVQSMLRTAGRHFSPAEQAELEGESHVLGARNLPTEEDLAGTHYLMGL